MATDQSYTPPSSMEDFFRSGNLTTRPNGTSDTTEPVARQGRVGIGAGIVADPVATLDVATVARTGVDGRLATTPAYVTGDLPGIGQYNQPVTPTGGVEIRHSNQTQGIGFAFNGMYATGSNPNQTLILLNKGNGGFEFQSQALNGNLNFYDWSIGIAATANTGSIHRTIRAGVSLANYYPYFIESVGPLNVRQQWDITANGGVLAGLRLQPDMAQAGNTTLYVGENRTNNRKIVLFDNVAASLTTFYGFGVNSSTLRYQMPGGAFHRFYSDNNEVMHSTWIGEGRVGVNMPVGQNPAANLEVRGAGIFGLAAVVGTRNASLIAGVLNAFATTVVNAAITAPTTVLNLAREGIAGITWASSAEFRLGKFLAGINAASLLQIVLGNGTTNMANVVVAEFQSNGWVRLNNLPVFANDAAAGVGGLTAGFLYRTPAGILQVKL